MPMKQLKGIRLPHWKKTAKSAPEVLPFPNVAYYPMHQNIGAPATVCVKVGDPVYVGTLIGEAGGYVSSPVYSGVSGKVKKIDETLMSGGVFSPTVIIEADGLTPDPSIVPPEVHDRESFIAAVRKSGVVGLGGAGFPTAVKLDVDPAKVEHVIINGAECEPYITSDTRTMLDRADEIAEGIDLLAKYLGVKSFIIGVEKNKPDCVKKMRDIAKTRPSVKVSVLPSVYPQGGEKVLIFNSTGKVVGEGMLPIDVGVIVINCTTVAEIAKFVKTGMPLVSKCVTVDGSAVKEPKNLILPIGTPATDAFEACGGFSCEPAKIVYGGPMMGVSVADITAPVLKQTNALLALSEKDARIPELTNCIRCGRCTNTCPCGLAPVAIVTAYEKEDMEALSALKPNLCMECGCCSYVCPAFRPLVQQNKLAKAALARWKQKQNEKEGK
ncbi:MAG: electron transport complex subunit RsxC [Clostridia bacterium]|nr:electron transport complex subunit RsxC [Clostridia bacterium]